MDIRALRTEDDYDWALAEIERYFDHEPEKGSAEAERFDVLAALIAAYEQQHWAIKAPDPIAAISAFMEMRGLKQTDLADVLGSRSRASEILNRRRALNIEMVHRIHTSWHVPADLLVQPYRLEPRSA
ncbi:transcriptional regulator [Tianweitania populi]|uniref:Transcriptional regulator n=2 Tax=Tianweitania populi TaxID=1607949 RepID=A0A8J3DQ34_9HYPH|nr:transcriptional regulator [Tianweitania populi]